MTDHKALAQKIKARHIMSIRPIGLYGSASKSCAWCSRNWPCDAVRAADALLEVAEERDQYLADHHGLNCEPTCKTCIAKGWT